VKNCVKRIKEFTRDLEYEIIVIDNGAHDKKVLGELQSTKHPDIRLIFSSKNLGFGGGNNLAAKTAQGEYLMFINSDVYVIDNSIKVLVDFIRRNPTAGAAGPKLLNGDKSLQYTCCRFHKPLTPIFRRTFLGNTQTGKKENDYHIYADWDHNSNQEVDWVQGSCLIIPKKIFEKVGPFDNQFFMYFEDTDLCKRIWRAGYKVYYVADAQMVHMHRKQSADKEGLGALTNKITLFHISSWFKYFLKWGFD